MTLNVNSVGDNPQQPSITAELYTPDQLIAGVFPLVTTNITLAAGTLARGTVLGQKASGTAVAAAKAGGNTGNGTCVVDGTAPLQAGAVDGVYTLTCTVAGTNSATFRLVNPAGDVLGDYPFSGSGASVTVNNQIKCVITDGGTDFVVGDGFTVTATLGNGSYIASVATATDGSQFPCAILADAADASGGAVTAGAYLTGEFNGNAITFDSSFTLAAVTAVLARRSIFIKTSVSAADPS